VKIRTILEVLAVFILFNVLKPVGAVLSTTGLLEREIGLLGWSYLGGVFLIILPITIIFFTRREFSKFGITRRNWQLSIDLALVSYLLSLISWLLGFSFIAFLRSSYNQPLDAGILSFGYLIQVSLLLYILNKRNLPSDLKITERKAKSNILICMLLFFTPIILGILFNSLNLRLISTVIWQFIFSGFGEEIYWRGYIQSSLNHGFGRPWKVASVQFGWGLIIASLLFGISHMLNPWNPLVGKYQLDVWWGVWTIFSGLFFGILREKTGTILAPALTHGLVDAVGEGLNVLIGYF